MSGVKGMLRNAPVSERFWRKVDRSAGPDACWPWLGGRNKEGYGKFQVGPRGQQRHWLAHRFAWFLTHGQEPKEQVCHTCDHPWCCNPKHHFEGDQLANRKDCAQKGRTATGDQNGARLHPERMPRGEKHGMAIVTADTVKKIRNLAGQLPVRQIAKQFDLNLSHVYQIINRRAWRHV